MQVSPTPFFCVVIPTHNRPEMATTAIKSVLAQTFKDFEIIIVDDGSSKDYEIVKKQILPYSNIKYLLKKNEGPSEARNYGIGTSSGKYICFLDDDDEYLENHLEVLHKEILRNNFSPGLYKTLTYFRKEKEMTKQNYQKTALTAKPIEKIFSNIFGTCNVAVSSEILKKNHFNSLPISEDFDLWARIALKYLVFEIQEYTTIYNFHGGNVSQAESETVHRKHIDAFRQIFSIPGLKKELPLKFRAELLYKRYLWLSEVQKGKKKYFDFLVSKTVSQFYKLLM